MSVISYGSLCSEVYNITKPIGGNYPDVPYYIRQLCQTDGRILEAMVGTGRLLIPLLEAGLNVEGIDRSPQMLALCRENCTSRNLHPTLHQGSIENLNIPGKFHAIIVTFGSFMLLANRSAAIKALRSFAQHLEPNGRVFIDLELPIASFKTENLVKQREIHCPDGSLILMQSSSRIDWLAQVEHNYYRYEKWKDGKLINTELEYYPFHWFGCEEFMMCLRENGYTNIELCANYTEGLEPTSYSDQLCFCATLA